jgi:hypothetical protein
VDGVRANDIAAEGQVAPEVGVCAGAGEKADHDMQRDERKQPRGGPIPRVAAGEMGTACSM